MKQFVLFTVCAIILFTLIPQSYAELYYNEKYSFSVDIPSGWTVTGIDPLSDEGILICDGNEELPFGMLDIGVWNTCIQIYYYPDFGVKQSDARERAMQIDYMRDLCNSATYSESEYTCENFQVVEKMPTAITIDGYPRITTITAETNYYPDYPVQDMVDTISFIYVGNDEWHAGNLSYHLKSRPVVLINKIAADKKFYYPFLLEIYNFTPETKCSKTKWQLRKAIIEVNKQKLLICY